MTAIEDLEGAAVALTPLQISALSIYVEGPRHPYDVYQVMLHRGEDRLVKVRPGSLYHAIGRLEQAGLLERTGRDREGNRPERTTYAITEAGERILTERVEEMLRRRNPEYPEFPIAAAEMALLTPRRAAAALEERAIGLRHEIDQLRDLEKHVKAIELPEVLWLDHQYLNTMATADLAWTERIIGRLRTGELGWTRAGLLRFAAQHSDDNRKADA